jgi:hypothetical protein
MSRNILLYLKDRIPGIRPLIEQAVRDLEGQGP